MAGKSGKRYNITSIDRARIRRLLAAHRWTIADLAKKVDTDPSAMGRIVNGKTKTSPILPQIFSALGGEFSDNINDFSEKVTNEALQIWDLDFDLAKDFLHFASWWTKKCRSVREEDWRSEEELSRLEEQVKYLDYIDLDDEHEKGAAILLRKLSKRNSELDDASKQRRRILGAALANVMAQVDKDFQSLPRSRWHGDDLPLAED